MLVPSTMADGQIQKSTGARVLLSGDVWRVVEVEKPDEHGVLRPTVYIEMTEPKDKDCLGVQRWHQLTLKSAQSEWMIFASRLLDRVLGREESM